MPHRETLLLAQVLLDAGLPDGVVNVIPTSRPRAISEPIITDPRLRKLSFTGSTAIGKVLLAQAAHNVLRTSMELGGNAPFLVFADADPDAAVDGAMTAKFRNIGQACTAANRFIVHESRAEEFALRLHQGSRADMRARWPTPLCRRFGQPREAFGPVQRPVPKAMFWRPRSASRICHDRALAVKATHPADTAEMIASKAENVLKSFQAS
jgi:hypothetical protein